MSLKKCNFKILKLFLRIVKAILANFIINFEVFPQNLVPKHVHLQLILIYNKNLFF